MASVALIALGAGSLTGAGFAAGLGLSTLGAASLVASGISTGIQSIGSYQQAKEQQKLSELEYKSKIVESLKQANKNLDQSISAASVSGAGLKPAFQMGLYEQSKEDIGIIRELGKEESKRLGRLATQSFIAPQLDVSALLGMSALGGTDPSALTTTTRTAKNSYLNPYKD
jgi:hypothetical protein